MPTSQLTNRRRQAERSAETIGRLLDATIATVVELGYGAATTREVCRRSGISQGGLFRHFATRRDLVVSAAASQLERDIAGPDAATGGATDDAVVRLRDAQPPESRALWLELGVAARTDEVLLDGLQPVVERRDAWLHGLASADHRFTALSPEARTSWLDVAEQLFRVDALWRQLGEPSARPDPADALEDLLTVLSTSRRRSPDEP